MLSNGAISGEESVRCLRLLRWMCRRQNTIPESMRTAIIDKIPSYPVRRGGPAGVFRGESRCRPVAVKAVCGYNASISGMAVKVNTLFCLRPETFSLSAYFIELLHRCRSSETPTTPEHFTVAWRNFWISSIFHSV